MKISLDRQFIHTGRLYGPGEVNVEDEAVAADLQKAQKRVLKQDAVYAAHRRGDHETAIKIERGELQPNAATPAPTSDTITYTKTKAAELSPPPEPKPAAPAKPAK